MTKLDINNNKNMEIKIKFDIGQTVYYLEYNKVVEKTLTDIKTHSYLTSFWDTKTTIDYYVNWRDKEERVFNIFWTKEELLESL